MKVFLGILQIQTHRHAVSVHAYALMKNHYHLIATSGDRLALPIAMKSIGVQYVHTLIGSVNASERRGAAIAR